MITDILNKLYEGADLQQNEISFFFSSMLKGEVSDIQASSFLTALKIKEPSPEEVYFASNVLLDNLGKLPKTNIDLIDLCGTGGDSKSTLNISTISSLILAALGVKVAKHGNRSVSSKVGSADLIEKLGINLDSSVESSIKSIKQKNFSFLYAPYFHKSMKNVGHIRKELKTRTIFNILGPLVNPLRPKKQVLGVYDKSLMKVVADVLIKQGVSRGFVVHGFDGMDEISICDKTYIIEINNSKVKEFVFNPSDYGFNLATIDKLIIDSSEESKEIALAILNNEIKDSRRDICVLNAGAGLYIYGIVDSLGEAFEYVNAKLDSGEVYSNLVSKIII